MPLVPVTPVHRPVSLRGAPPRFQIFDRRKSPPMTVARFYRDPERDDLVVFEVYDDVFREFLKLEEPFRGRRFAWMLDVEPDAPHDPRAAIIRPHPMPEPALHGANGDPALTLEEAIAACRAPGFYRIVRASDPV